MTDLNGNGLIYLGFPRERIYFPQFVDNRDQILAELHKTGRDCGYFQAEGHRVDRNRDKICAEFLKNEKQPEWLLMLDTDMEHPTDIPMRLARWNKPIVAGLYFHRGQSHDPFAFEDGPEIKDIYGRTSPSWIPMRDVVFDYLERMGIPMRDGALTVDSDNGEGLIECDAVATGTMLIHRSVLEAMKPGPWFEYITGGNSEDLVFCRVAKRVYNFPIFCDLSTISGHFSLVPLGQAQFRMHYINRGINFTSYSKRNAAEMYAEFFEMTEEQAIAEIEAGDAQMVSKLWQASFDGKQPTPAQETAFYASPEVGKAYVMELLHWNFTPTFNQMRTQLVHIRNQKVLEIGAGIGSMSLQMVVQNNETVAVEINEILRRFMALRYGVIAKNVTTTLGGLSIITPDDLADYSSKTFHSVLAFDVLEHLPLPELKKLLGQISRLLVSGGHLYYHGNWHQQDIYPMHHDYTKEWPGLLKQFGLSPINQITAVKLES